METQFVSMWDTWWVPFVICGGIWLKPLVWPKLTEWWDWFG